MPNYQALADALRNLSALSEAAEAHALLCALSTGGANVNINAWIDSLLSGSLVLEDAATQAALKVLGEMYQATKLQFANNNFEFYLLLPSDDAPFYQRIAALAMWCQSYLAGLGLMQIDFSQGTQEVTEAVEDLVNISRLQYDGEVDGAEDQEKSYTELVEYTKVAVLLIDSEFGIQVDKINTEK